MHEKEGVTGSHQNNNCHRPGIDRSGDIDRQTSRQAHTPNAKIREIPLSLDSKRRAKGRFTGEVE